MAGSAHVTPSPPPSTRADLVLDARTLACPSTFTHTASLSVFTCPGPVPPFQSDIGASLGVPEITSLFFCANEIPILLRASMFQAVDYAQFKPV